MTFPRWHHNFILGTLLLILGILAHHARSEFLGVFLGCAGLAYCIAAIFVRVQNIRDAHQEAARAERR